METSVASDLSSRLESATCQQIPGFAANGLEAVSSAVQELPKGAYELDLSLVGSHLLCVTSYRRACAVYMPVVGRIGLFFPVR